MPPTFEYAGYHWSNNDMNDYDIVERNIGFEALYESAEKCKSSVLWKASVSSYILNQAERTLKLEKELKSGKYKARDPKRFTITYPKEREILSISFRDRVYQRSLNDVTIYPAMVKPFIYDNLACQKGKGTDLARERFKKYLKRVYIRERKMPYVLKCDIRKYYDSIPHNKVEEMFRKYLDPWTAEHGTSVLRAQYSGDRGYNPGSQMVQIVGMAYLNPLDHFIKERLHCREYVRNMDDFMLMSTDRETLLRWKDEIASFLQSYELELHPDKTKICSAKDGVMFLGFTFRMTDTGKIIMLIDPKNVKHERKKLARLVHLASIGEIEKEKVYECYTSWKAHASKGNSYHLLQRMDKYIERLWAEEMDIREKKLLEFAVANAENTVKLSEQSQSVIDYNVMMGNLADPEQEENADE